MTGAEMFLCAGVVVYAVILLTGFLLDPGPNGMP
jgi:hypothetical protein